MEELLDVDGTGGTIKTQLDEITKALTGTDGIKDLVDAASKNQGNLNVKDKFDALKAAVAAANTAIDEKLNSGDLTQLDTANLKALKSSITDIQSQLESIFTDFGVDTTKAAPITQDKAKELLASLESGVLESNTELGEKAVGVVTSSQKQAETIAENVGEMLLRVLFKTLR